MKWLNIINFMLCIIIIHLLIKNLDMNYSFNEHFNQMKININPVEESNPSDDLYSFINGPMASNEFSSDKGSSNFQSNIIDTNSFFNIESNKLQEEFIYKNELPMNGGPMNNVVGNSQSDDKFSSIDQLLNPIEKQSMSNIDDLRNGIDPPNLNKFFPTQ